MKRRLSHLFVLTACLTVTGCGVEPTDQANKNTVASPLPSATASPSPAEEAANAELLTLPVLDAFFADESFSESLKTRLQLTDEQVTKLKELAHSETAKLNEANAGKGEGESSNARSVAAEKISALIGAEKTRQLAVLVGELWSGATDDVTLPTEARKATLATVPNFILIMLYEFFQDWRAVKDRTTVRFQHAADHQLISVEGGL